MIMNSYSMYDDNVNKCDKCFVTICLENINLELSIHCLPLIHMCTMGRFKNERDRKYLIFAKSRSS